MELLLDVIYGIFHQIRVSCDKNGAIVLISDQCIMLFICLAVILFILVAPLACLTTIKSRFRLPALPLGHFTKWFITLLYIDLDTNKMGAEVFGEF